MLEEFALVPSRQSFRRLDAIAVVAVLAFLALGVASGLALGRLAEVSASLREAAQALDLTARGIGLLGEVPFVGESAARLAGSVTETAASLRTSAGNVRGNVVVLAVVVGATIAVLPLPILLGLYVPMRLARRREERGLRRLLAGPVDPMLVEHLARAAVARVPYRELRRVSTTPWRDVEGGRHRLLAAAELRRLGLAVPQGWDVEPSTDPARSAGSR